MTNWIEEGRDVMRAPHWQWVPGMLTCGGLRIVSIHGDQWFVTDDDETDPGRWEDVDPDAVPDLEDAATVGAVLTLVWNAMPYGSTFSLDRTPGALRLWRAASWMLEKVGRSSCT